MGKWCHVRCDCFGRAPIRGAYPDVQICSHAGGVLVEGWPYYLFEIGWTIREVRGEQQNEPGPDWRQPRQQRIQRARAAYPTGVFRMFRRFSPILFVEEYLVFTVEETAEWRDEIEALAGALDGRCPPGLDRSDVVALDARLRRRAYEGSASVSLASFYGGAPDDRRHDTEAEYTHLRGLGQAVDFGRSLCDASLATGNPIEFFW